ncbi:glycoside hydrolase [Lenzites betulinus]|nr:glycoside hydrolase [Lenzites betulinus]
MNMENFISGYPGCEFQIRAALSDVVGTQKSELFFDKFLEYFFQDADAAFFKSLGLNCIRLPFNYRHFEDDMNPRVLKPEGFKHLDRVIDLCAKHGIYTILDLHTAPGGQNTDWHADAGTHIANFWTHKDFQDRIVWLWEELAKHYVGNTWIAGYNPLNEPTDPYHTRIIDVYDRLYGAIRAIDPHHALFLDGNTFASDFSHFGDAHKRWENVAYSIHDYSVFGFPAAPEPYTSTEVQLHRLRRSYEKKRQWMDERGLCVWNGEWGPVYARKEYEGERTDAINTERYQVLKDQLAIYNKDRLSWSIWLYKDIGFQGMVFVSRETPYMTLFKDFLAKKHRLAIDAWGADDAQVRDVYKPLVDLIKREVKPEHQSLYPAPVWKLTDRIGRLSRNILVSEFLVQEWAEHFRGKSEAEIDEIARSFSFESCLHREGLNKILTDNATLVKDA